MVKTIDKLREEMERIGGTVEDTGYDIHLDAPSGYVWRANNLTSYTIHYANNSQSWLAKAVKIEKAGLRMGLEKVSDAKQIERIRFDLGDDSWGSPDAANQRLSFLSNLP